MRLLVLHSLLGVLRGGGENFTRSLFDAFSERGHRTTAAFIADGSGRYPIPLPPSMEPAPLPGWWSSDLGQEMFSAIGKCIPAQNSLRKRWDGIQEAVSWRVFRWHNQRFQQRVEREFRDRWNEFDAVYVHGDTLLARSVAQHKPTMLRLPGPVGPELADALRSVHAVFANGDALARIRTFLGDHARELPIGIDTNLFRPGGRSARPTLNWTEEHHVVGYVGRLAHIKGVDLLVGAFGKILDCNPNMRLLIVGSGEQERNIRSALSRELAQGIVHIEPDVGHETLGDWYRAMDLLVMPSRYENFSNAILEGLACGVPFLAADVGGNKIMAKAGGGWLFEAGSDSSLAACLGKILGSRCELKARGAIGLEYVKQQHSWLSTAKCLEQAIESHLGVR